MLGPHGVPVGLAPLLTHGHEPVPLAFALADGQHPGAGVHVRAGQVDNFLAADAAGLDELVFEAGERGPQDTKMRLLFEAIERLGPEAQGIIRELLEGMIVKYEVRRWTATG